MRKIIAASVGAVVLAFSLAGCITIQLPAGTGEEQSSGANLDCEETDEITEPGTYTLLGRCSLVTVVANDVTITGDDVREFDITGDRVVVTAAASDTVTVDGNTNSINIADLGEAQVSGDRNAVRTGAILDRIIVNGHDNAFEAEGITAVFDNGERTEITAPVP